MCVLTFLLNFVHVCFKDQFDIWLNNSETYLIDREIIQGLIWWKYYYRKVTFLNHLQPLFITIKLGAWRWSSTFITVFFHIPTPIISDSISIVLLQVILRILTFRFNEKKLRFEVFWIGERLDHLLLEEILVILECRLQIV